VHSAGAWWVPNNLIKAELVAHCLWGCREQRVLPTQMCILCERGLNTCCGCACWDYADVHSVRDRGLGTHCDVEGGRGLNSPLACQHLGSFGSAPGKCNGSTTTTDTMCAALALLPSACCWWPSHHVPACLHYQAAEIGVGQCAPSYGPAQPIINDHPCTGLDHLDTASVVTGHSLQGGMSRAGAKLRWCAQAGTSWTLQSW